MPSPSTVAVIGGGIVGLASAYKLQQSSRYDRVVVLEKEADVGRHQSAHNSGVLHAGPYYAPGSLKARFAVEGLREMVAFCREHGIALVTEGRRAGRMRSGCRGGGAAG